ncbi:VOC family protein [Mycobacterium sp. URHB0044]|uniref:VOC family protein n=1 Tax=Mycobacterium sp. URHB0044 TaxID=1380386 RepID=UPI00048ACFAB|nr:VOC family protein [Mycobacterium sp. URHB0044]
MPIVLDHTIAPATNSRSAATFFAELMGLEVSPPSGPFLPVSINESLTFDFDERGQIAPAHFGFLVDDDTFQAMLDRLATLPAIEFGSGPEHGWDRQTSAIGGGRGVYVRDPDNGHTYELFTVRPATP